MKVKLLSALILFTSQFSFSQTIKGKVVFNNYAIPKVEVINASTKHLQSLMQMENFQLLQNE
jgi:hypothetical protein